MQAAITPEAEKAVADIAQRRGLSPSAVLAMLLAIHTGGGRMAQFSIPELGGSGQWMQGGMTMVGDMFDNALKARVDGLCAELSLLLATTTVFPPEARVSTRVTSANWWPAELGLPSAVGTQNTMRYAVFPGTHRLALQIDGVTRIFDTGQHQISGVQQQQSNSRSDLPSFSSQLGTFDITDLDEIDAQRLADTPTAAPAPTTAPEAGQQMGRHAHQTPATQPAAAGHTDVIAAIEALGGLHQRGILSDEEFSTKKAELLKRL